MVKKGEFMWVRITPDICVTPGCGGEIIEIWDSVYAVSVEPDGKDQLVDSLISRCCSECAVCYGFSRSNENSKAIRRLYDEAKMIGLEERKELEKHSPEKLSLLGRKE